MNPRSHILTLVAIRSQPWAAQVLSVWDFGGQRLFSSLHHIFLTPEGIYLVVFDMRLLLPGGDPVRRRECLATLVLWCNSIFVFAGPKGDQQGAPVLLVGTCLDEVSSPTELDAVCSSVEDEVRVELY